MRQLLPRLLYGLAASSTIAALNIYQAHHFDALEDDWVMHQQATLPHRTWVCFCFLATVVSSLPSFFHWLGSSTLGSYVAHSYINLIFTVTLLDKSFTCAGKVAQDDPPQLAEDARAATPVTSDSLKDSCVCV